MDLKSMMKKPVNIALAVAGVLATVAFVMLILALTAYKGRTPITTVDGVVLRDLHISHNLAKLSVDLNLSVKNPNKVVFKTTKSNAVLVYKDVLVGEAVIEAGEIPPGATKSMTVRVTILADRLQGNRMFRKEVSGGTLSFNIYTKISGKVTVFKMVKVPVISTNLCSFDINVKGKNVGQPKCTEF